ncbi:MAG TPA: 4a-hydroxytetrahydrobiopterin dehydratase [Actinomycetaceae bacterium]|nr:4a-hydroxytetrahydrobiopterin dehydratase [Actinomycetaceae bacterium]
MNTADETQSSRKLTAQQLLDAGLSDWRQLSQALHARFATGDYAKGAALVAAVAEAADKANHHPDVTLTYPHVDITTRSHDVGGITVRDIDLAREISRIAAEQGVVAEPRD